MKVVILAGGYGTRLSEYTDVIPKPMVTIGSKPIIWHIMQHYSSYGYNDFVIALGYKSHVIKEYFSNYPLLDRDFAVDFKTGKIEPISSPILDWKVTLVDTGIDSLTGTRLKNLKPYLQDRPFMLTYGDGLSDVNINDLVNHHQAQSRLVTVTAVRPPARFGELILSENSVIQFSEKPQLHEGWINGGFFVMEPAFIDLIPDQNVMLERDPLEAVVNRGELAAYQHYGFWQCMDTKRDRDLLEKLYAENPPWRTVA